MQLPTSLFVAAITLSLSSVTGAVCKGFDVAIGTAHALTNGRTQWTIYSPACAVLDVYSQPTAVSICDSQIFLCSFGTASIGQYDDRKTGWAYNATADPVSEGCWSDIIIRCVNLTLSCALVRYSDMSCD